MSGDRPFSPNRRYDVIAGITAAAVVLPKAMATQRLRAFPWRSGSIGLNSIIAYGLLGSSHVLSVSSTTTLAILTASDLALVVPDGDPLRLTMATAT